VTLTDFREVKIVIDYEETILQLVDYELWANFKLLDFIEGLSGEESNRDFGFGLRTTSVVGRRRIYRRIRSLSPYSSVPSL